MLHTSRPRRFGFRLEPLRSLCLHLDLRRRCRCPTPLASTESIPKEQINHTNLILSQCRGDLSGSTGDVAFSSPHRCRAQPASLRRPSGWRHLIEPNAALIAFLLVALYVFLSTTWAADPGAAFAKAAEFLMVVVITFTANRGVVRLDEHKSRRAALACAAGISWSAVPDI